MSAKKKSFSPERRTVSKRIEMLREAEGLTQTDFALQLGMEKGKGRSKVNNWEQSDCDVKADDIAKIASTFNVPADYLLGLTDETYNDADLQMIHRVTGLSSGAISKLQSIAEKASDTDFPIIISALIEHENAEYFLSLLQSIIAAYKMPDSEMIEMTVDNKLCRINSADFLKTILQTRFIESLPRLIELFNRIEYERSV